MAGDGSARLVVVAGPARHCTIEGHVTVVACGIEGADLDGTEDFRLLGLAPQACAVVAMHEAAHALLHLRLGVEPTTMMLAEARGADAAMSGWSELCRDLSQPRAVRPRSAGELSLRHVAVTRAWVAAGGR